MSSSERLQQVANHLSNNYARGLLNGEVAIITGAFLVSFIGAPFSINFPLGAAQVSFIDAIVILFLHTHNIIGYR